MHLFSATHLSGMSWWPSELWTWLAPPGKVRLGQRLSWPEVIHLGRGSSALWWDDLGATGKPLNGSSPQFHLHFTISKISMQKKYFPLAFKKEFLPSADDFPFQIATAWAASDIMMPRGSFSICIIEKGLPGGRMQWGKMKMLAVI